MNVRRKVYHKDFYALNNINFNIKVGETVGIIGKNGAGKSTLLKIITGVLAQTSGEMIVKGKIAALLELGAGFNPEFTGIENVYLNGRIMGFTKKEMDQKLESIIKFADIGDFIYQPIKTYSSGMFARLAFSVAVSVEPDILIVDEALSVGDMQFQEKSITKMKEIRDKGTTIIYVSHSLPSVRNFCERAIWFSNGSIKEDGDADIVCENYEEFLREEQFVLNEDFSNRDIKNKSIAISNIVLNKDIYTIDEDIIIELNLDYIIDTIDYGVGIIVYNEKGKVVTLFNTVRDDLYFDKKNKVIRLIIPENDFIAGKYYISASICDKNVMFSYDKVDYAKSFTVKNKKNKLGIPISDGMFRAKHFWEYKGDSFE
nr:polysaccharide ABC transporter ATP-binding protein [Sebaldella sp. S0638]